MRISQTLLPLLAALLSACATQPSYTPPTAGPRAKVVVQSSQNISLGSTYYEDTGTCRYNSHILGVGEKRFELIVPANRDARFLVGAGFPTTCNIFFSFTPEDQKSYLVDFTWVDKLCYIAVYDQTTAEPKTVKSKKFEYNGTKTFPWTSGPEKTPCP